MIIPLNEGGLCGVCMCKANTYNPPHTHTHTHTHTQVTFATSEHLPLGTSMSDSIEYMQITNLRVRLLGQFDLSSTDYQYYSVGEWVINGTCMCNGHAAMCAPAPNETLATDKVCIVYKTALGCS